MPVAEFSEIFDVCFLFIIFTALHWMKVGLVARKVSVRPSVKHVNCDKTEEKSVQIFTPYERLFILVFWEKEWLVGVRE